MLIHVSSKVDRLKKSCKNKYYANLLNDTTHSKRWKNISSIFGFTKNRDKICLTVNGTETENDWQTCEILNAHFSSIGKNLANSIPTINRSDPFSIIHCIQDSIFLLPCSENEITPLIFELNSKKACGYDNIPARLLKDNCSTFSKILYQCFNTMIETGQYPDCLKNCKNCPNFQNR